MLRNKLCIVWKIFSTLFKISFFVLKNSENSGNFFSSPKSSKITIVQKSTRVQISPKSSKNARTSPLVCWKCPSNLYRRFDTLKRQSEFPEKISKCSRLSVYGSGKLFINLKCSERFSFGWYLSRSKISFSEQYFQPYSRTHSSFWQLRNSGFFFFFVEIFRETFIRRFNSLKWQSKFSKKISKRSGFS